MESLTSPSCCRVSSSSASLVVREKSCFVNRLESCFLRTRKVSGFGLLSSIFVQQSKAIYPVSCVSPKAQVDFEEVNVQTEDKSDRAKTVHVKFQLEKECLFGQQFLMVGEDPMFGMWDPESAVSLTWSDQHVWFAELDIPIGKSIQYKFILKDGAGNILWQPGPDRVFQGWETKNMIVVSDDWENAELHVITEEEKKSGLNENSDVVLDVTKKLAIANNDKDLSKQQLVQPSNEQALKDIIPLLQEKPSNIVPNGTSYTKNDPILTSGPQMVNQKSISSTCESFATISKKDVVVSEEILENNSRAATVSLVNYEGEPILVPGLPPFPEFPAEEENYNQVGERISFNDSVEAVEAKDHSLPELQSDEKQEQHRNHPQNRTTDEMIDNEKRKAESELQQKPNFAKIDEQSDSEPEDNSDSVLNDLQWGQKTLQKFLTNFGLF